MKTLHLFVALLLLSAVAVSLLAAAPQAPRGPGQDLVTLCHWSITNHRYNKLELGQAAAAKHLAEHWPGSDIPQDHISNTGECPAN